KVHQHDVVAELFVTPDALVVVDEVSATVEDEPVCVYLNGPWMVRGVAMDQIDAAIDQPMSEAHILARHRVAPVAPPVNGGDQKVPRTFGTRHAIENRDRGRLGQILEQGDARTRGASGPTRGDASGFGADRKHDEAAPVPQGNASRPKGLLLVATRPDDFESRVCERLHRLHQAGIAVVEDVV